MNPVRFENVNPNFTETVVCVHTDVGRDRHNCFALPPLVQAFQAEMNSPTRYKQVIVMRHDLKMRRGKQIAQGAHASMSFLCQRMTDTGKVAIDDFDEPARAWLSGAFAKVCCRVDSEDELMRVFECATEAGLETHLITDSGKTEFHGVPTRTCLAIGPDLATKIDAITGELRQL